MDFNIRPIQPKIRIRPTRDIYWRRFWFCGIPGKQYGSGTTPLAALNDFRERNGITHNR